MYDPEQVQRIRAARDKLHTMIQEMVDEFGPLVGHVFEPDEFSPDGMEVPSGPYLLSGWVLATDWAALNEEGGTWTRMHMSNNLCRTQSIGLADMLYDWAKE